MENNEDSKRLEIDKDLLWVIESSISTGINEGVRRAVESIKNQERLKDKITYDNRLKNTRLLLKNYRKFVKACEQTTYTEEELDTATVSELLDKIYCSYDNEITVVQAILKSKKRTEIMVTHIARMVRFYMFECNNIDNIEQKRRSDIIYKLYVEGNKQPKMSEMAEMFNVCERQINRDINKAVEEIAVLIFRS